MNLIESFIIVALISTVLLLVLFKFVIKRELRKRNDEPIEFIEELGVKISYEIGKMSETTVIDGRQNRIELQNSFHKFTDSLFAQISEINKNMSNKLDRVHDLVDTRLNALQSSNEVKLDQMRSVVDEKLQSTLEKRLSESFNFVSSRLEAVHKGLGEMQTLAAGVGDLKKVLSNVKTRGTWGEVTLEALLENILTPGQYERNVATKPGSLDRVEFGIKLPGKNNNCTWLPIDAKFPLEDFNKLLDAVEKSDIDSINVSTRTLEARIKAESKKINEKYIDPPGTLDFAIMFLPVEGLYAEVLRIPGLFDFIQREYRVIITGPTTISALLNSLQLGFQTLAIQHRTSEVWRLLRSVKNEFGNFAGILEKTQKKIKSAGETLELASKKTLCIEKKLGDISDLPVIEEKPS